MFNSFAAIPAFLDVQMSAARKKCWDNEVKVVYLPKIFPGASEVSPQSVAFLLDMTILTNGPGKAGFRRLSGMTYASENERLHQVYSQMETAPDYSDKKRADILERERCFINGSGTVHGDSYDLKSYGLVPWAP